MPTINTGVNIMKSNVLVGSTVACFLLFFQSVFSDILPKDPRELFDSYIGSDKFNRFHVITSEADALTLAEQPVYDPNDVIVTKALDRNQILARFLAKETQMSLKLAEDERYTADLFIYPGANDSDPFSSPIVIGDAFDPKDSRSVADIQAVDEYYNLLRNGSYRRVTIHTIQCFDQEDATGDDVQLQVISDGTNVFSLSKSMKDIKVFAKADLDYIWQVDRSFNLSNTLEFKIYDKEFSDDEAYPDKKDLLGSFTVSHSTAPGLYKEYLNDGWNNGNWFNYGITYSIEDIDVTPAPVRPGVKRVNISRLIVHKQEDGTGNDDTRIRIWVDGNLVMNESKSMDDLHTTDLNEQDNGHVWTINRVFEYTNSLKIDFWDLDWPDPDDSIGVLDLDASTKPSKHKIDKFDGDGALYSLDYSVEDLGVNKNFISPREAGYDIFFLDFSQGGGDIRKNAKLLTKVMETLEANSSSKYVVAGISMSGIVARLALLYSLPQNNTYNSKILTNAKGFFTVDSPLQGASIGDLQSMVWSVMGDTLAQIVGSAPVDQYAQLSVPAAHQMLYGHHYYRENSEDESYTSYMKQSDAQANFYNMLKEMGDYRSDLPFATIATSNFHKPHPELDMTVRNEVQKIDRWVLRRSIYAGGQYPYQKYELYPGSCGNFYYDLVNFGRGTSSPQENATSGEKFKGTFIPIHSSLDLRGFEVLNPSLDRSENNLARYSPADRCFYFQNQYNEYRGDYSVDGMRFSHIYFNYMTMQKIQAALQFIESQAQIIASAAPAGQQHNVQSIQGGWYRITDLPVNPYPVSYTIEVSCNDGKPLTGITAIVSEQEVSLDGYKQEITVQNVGQSDILLGFFTNRKIHVSWYPNYEPMKQAVTFGHDNEAIALKTYNAPSMPYVNLLLMGPRRVIVNAPAYNTPVVFNTDGEYWYNITAFPTDWVPRSINILIQPVDGFQLSGNALIENQTFALSSWDKQIAIPYTGQKNILVKIKAEQGRSFQLQWWPENSTNSDPSVDDPSVDDPETPVYEVSQMSSSQVFDLSGDISIRLSNFPSWPVQSLTVQLQPADGMELNGTTIINGESISLNGWNQDICIPYNGEDQIIFTINSNEYRQFRIQWWSNGSGCGN